MILLISYKIWSSFYHLVLCHMAYMKWFEIFCAWNFYHINHCYVLVFSGNIFNIFISFKISSTFSIISFSLDTSEIQNGWNVPIFIIMSICFFLEIWYFWYSLNGFKALDGSFLCNWNSWWLDFSHIKVWPCDLISQDDICIV